jgi:hypothetical protein
MSSGRLFLDRVARQQSPSPLHRHAQTTMHPCRNQAKPDISTLQGIGHFYFALTSRFSRCVFAGADGLHHAAKHFGDLSSGPGIWQVSAVSIATCCISGASVLPMHVGRQSGHDPLPQVPATAGSRPAFRDPRSGPASDFDASRAVVRFAPLACGQSVRGLDADPVVHDTGSTGVARSTCQTAFFVRPSPQISRSHLLHETPYLPPGWPAGHSSRSALALAHPAFGIVLDWPALPSER